MQNGVFTKQITDPTGRCAVVHDAAAGTWTIPQSCWDPTAKLMKAIWPLPLTPNNPVSNYYVAPLAGTNANQWNGRVDYNVSEKQRVFARYAYWPLQDISANESNDAGGFKTGNSYSSSATHQAVLGDTYTISPSLVADVRVSYLRSFYNQVPPCLGTDPSTFGPSYAALAPLVTFKVLPLPSLAGSDGIWAFPASTFVSADRWNNYDMNGSVTKVAGNHTLKFGGSGRLMQRSGLGNVNGPSGRFNFASTYTGDEFAPFSWVSSLPLRLSPPKQPTPITTRNVITR